MNRLTELFVHTFSDRAVIHVQNPIRLSEYTEPQPDLTLLRRRSDFYSSRAVGPEDIFLVVEIADTSLAYDRQVKMRLYGRSGIAEYWVIDLNAETVTVCRDAGPDGYRMSQVVRRSEQIAPVAVPDRPVAVDSMLG